MPDAFDGHVRERYALALGVVGYKLATSLVLTLQRTGKLSDAEAEWIFAKAEESVDAARLSDGLPPEVAEQAHQILSALLDIMRTEPT